MSEYIIKGDDSFSNIPVIDVGDPADYSLVQMIPIAVEFGTQAEPKRIWKSGQAYMDCYHYIDTQGYHHYDMEWYDLSGWTHSNPQPPYVSNIGNVSEIFIGASKSGENGLVCWSVSGTFPNSNGILFNGQYTNMPIEEVIDWDESPSDDPQGNPQNMNAIGGEFADTDPFGFGNTDIDLPNTIQEMDYSGFITPYKIDNGGLFALAGAIFSSDTWTNLRNKFNGVGNPIDYIVSCVEIPYSANADANKNFNLGGIDVVDGNGGNVSLPYFTHRYEKLNFGSITLKETWGTEKDYSTTNVSIYLPYVGLKDLDTSIIMNSTITLTGILDIWSGDLLYIMKINNKSMAYKYLASSGLVYRFQGNCGKQVPIGKIDNSNQLMAMTGSMASMGVGLAMGNPMMALGGAAGLIGSAAMPPKVSMTGGITGAIGRGDTDEPYLIITQSVPVYPNNWRSEIGAPRYQEFQVNELSGYTEFFEIHADDVSDATDSEKAEIENLLKSGVFIA